MNLQRLPVLLATLLLAVDLAQTESLGTAFAYQGHLTDGNRPAGGLYDLRFAVYDAPVEGLPSGAAQTYLSTKVTDGLFTAILDFGPAVFSGGARWLEIAVATNGVSTFTTLSPRQPLLPVPYALHATADAKAMSMPAASLTGVLSLSQLPTQVVTNGASGVRFGGTFVGDGLGLTNMDLRHLQTHGALTWTSAASFDLAPAVSVSVGQFPHGVAVGDVDDDGRLDLVSANYTDNSLTVLTNNGHGTFGLLSTRAVGSQSSGVVLADINNDGLLDLISVNTGGGTLTVLTNRNATFSLARHLAVGSGPRAVAAADLNGDGWADLASANAAASTLTVHTNNQQGGFVLAAAPGVGFQPYAVIATDANGDGWMDLVSANFQSNTLTVLTNDGAGGWATASSPTVGNRPYSVAAGDIDGDGRIELVSADALGGTLTVLTNAGQGRFAARAAVNVGGTPIFVTAADLNQDAWLDLAIVNNASNQVMVLTNDGHGSFAVAAVRAAGNGPWALAVADVTGDGTPDIVTANAADHALGILAGTPPAYRAAFAGSGAGLTDLDAAQLSGTLMDGRLSSNVALVDGSRAFSGTVTAPGFAGSGAGLTNLNLAASGGWKTTGNAGTTAGTHFLGTTDNRPLELRAKDVRALSLSHRKTTGLAAGDYTEGVNLLGGHWSNSVASGAVGATVAGGGAAGAVTGIKTGKSEAFQRLNQATDDYATVSGGGGNTAGYAGTVAGGLGNTASDRAAAVPGGEDNTASGKHSLAAGRHANALHQGTFVWADSRDVPFVSTAANQFLVRAAGGVGINTTNITGGFTLRGGEAGNWSTPLGFIENTNASGNSGPALRLLSAGNSLDGVLNVGTTGTGKVLALGGAGGEVANVSAQGALVLKGGVTVDAGNANSNSLAAGLLFGEGSGEGIFSRRGVAGPNQWGLDLCTFWVPRISIANNGSVGIGTADPQAPLDIDTGNGRVRFLSDVVPTVKVVSNASNPGILRLRNALEVWPSEDIARAGRMDVRGTNGSPTITLDGASGMATVKVLEITGGSDVAEPFPMADDSIPKGAVVVIDDETPGRLRLSTQAYDTRVAGIVSGAGGVNPGLLLRQQGVLEDGQNVALSGRVYALADASHGSIKPGDLLTTSATPGHVMAVTDHTRAWGAIVGKAMSGLKEGQGLVLVLVSLQ